MDPLSFGTIYFHHMKQTEYVGPKLTREVGGTFVQLDTSDVGLWYLTEKRQGVYDWSLLDEAYGACEQERVEPVPSFSHHFMPPSWIEKGPFDDNVVDASEYEGYGEEFKELTLVQKSFADFVADLVKRYGNKTKLYVFSHEWNLTQAQFAKPGSVEYGKLLRNQLISTILAYKIIRRMQPSAKVTAGLLNFYRRDAENGRQLNALASLIEEWPFGPRYMIRKYVETGDEDYLRFLETTYLFYASYSASKDGFGPFYFDDRVGEALEELYNGSVTVDRKRYYYRDYIRGFIISPVSMSTKWTGNLDRFYTEEEQAKILKTSLEKVIEAENRGIPISRIIVSLNDKNEDWTKYAQNRWLYVPEGVYRMKGFRDPLIKKPTDWPISYEPKKAAEIFRRYAEKYKK